MEIEKKPEGKNYITQTFARTKTTVKADNLTEGGFLLYCNKVQNKKHDFQFHQVNMKFSTVLKNILP